MIYVLAVVVIVIAALLAYVMTRPDSFRVERSAVIHAHADKVHRLVSDFHEWSRWSPWEKLDPAMQRTHSGAQDGRGAIYEWSGNKKAGAGRMEITESTPSNVTIKLDFIKPFEGHNITEFQIRPDGDATQVNWIMHGPATFATKMMSAFFNLDRMIGKDFEEGLANLKRAAEGTPTQVA